MSDFDDCQCEEFYGEDFSALMAEMNAEEDRREAVEEFWRFYQARALELESVN